MALYLRQNTPGQTSSKVAADLARRLQKRTPGNDYVDSSVLLSNQHRTTGGGLFWTIIIGFVLLAGLVYLIFFL